MFNVITSFVCLVDWDYTSYGIVDGEHDAITFLNADHLLSDDATSNRLTYVFGNLAAVNFVTPITG